MRGCCRGFRSSVQRCQSGTRTPSPHWTFAVPLRIKKLPIVHVNNLILYGINIFRVLTNKKKQKQQLHRCKNFKDLQWKVTLKSKLRFSNHYTGNWYIITALKM